MCVGNVDLRALGWGCSSRRIGGGATAYACSQHISLRACRRGKNNTRQRAHTIGVAVCRYVSTHTHRITCVRALRLIIQRARSSLCFGARNVLCLCGVCNGMCCVLQKLAPFSLLPAAALHGQFRTHVRARSKRFRSVQPYIPSMLNWRDRLP